MVGPRIPVNITSSPGVPRNGHERFLLVQKMARDLYLEAKQLLDSGFFTNIGRKIDPIVVMGELEKRMKNGSL